MADAFAHLQFAHLCCNFSAILQHTCSTLAAHLQHTCSMQPACSQHDCSTQQHFCAAPPAHNHHSRRYNMVMMMR